MEARGGFLGVRRVRYSVRYMRVGKFSVGNGRLGRGRVGQDGELGRRAFYSDRLQCSRAKDGGDSIRWWEMVVGWCPTCTWVISAAGRHTLVQVFCQNNFCL